MSDAAQPQAGMVSAEQLAALLLLTRERIGQLVRDGIIPKAAKGQYPLVGAIQGYVRFLKENAKQTSKSAAHARATDARAREIELRIAEREGKSIDAEDFIAFADDLCGRLVAGLAALPARCERDPVRRRKIEAECDAIRSHIVAGAKESSDRLRSGLPVSPAEPEDDA